VKSSAIIGVMALVVLATDAQGDHWTANPPFDQDLTSFCDLHDKAAMSERCFGFVSAVVEITVDEDLPSFKRRICLPANLNVKKIFEAIRPELRSRYGRCLGFCTAAGYVQTSLYATFPCKR